MSNKISITSPVGRIVQGSLYEPSTKDAEGKPLIIKNGPNAGQTRVNYFFAIAIPKGPEKHWAETSWGSQIWNVGHIAFPNIASNPSFAWKIEDGDSQIPNKKGHRPCDKEGFKGNWIIKFSAGYAPKIWQQDAAGWVQLMQPDFVKPGYFVEVNFTVEGNGSAQQAGVYINHSMVCFRGYGPEIVFGPDVKDAGFGQAPLPPGASATPLASVAPMPQAPVAAPAPSYVPTPAPAMAYAPPAANVVPNTQFLQVPAAAPLPMPAKQMTAAAKGIPYEDYQKIGWTDAQLVQAGLMLA